MGGNLSCEDPSEDSQACLALRNRKGTESGLSENQKDCSLENREAESDYSDMVASQAKANSDSNLLKMPTLDEGNVEEFLELEAKLKTAFDEEGFAELRDNQGRGGRKVLTLGGGGGGGGGATGARNALLSGTKSSPNLKTRSYSLQTPTILEGMATSSAREE